MAGYDQGIVNRLCHGDDAADLPGLVLHPYRSSPVLHLGNAPPGTVRLDGAGELRNDDGELVAIVHQYDRHPELASLATRLANR
jgi:hypothetical protein